MSNPTFILPIPSLDSPPFDPSEIMGRAVDGIGGGGGADGSAQTVRNTPIDPVPINPVNPSKSTDRVKPQEIPTENPKNNLVPKPPEKEQPVESERGADSKSMGMGAQSANDPSTKKSSISTGSSFDEGQKTSAQDVSAALRELADGVSASDSFSVAPRPRIDSDQLVPHLLPSQSRGAYTHWDILKLRIPEREARFPDAPIRKGLERDQLQVQTDRDYQWRIFTHEDIGGGLCNERTDIGEGEIHQFNLPGRIEVEFLRVEYWNCYSPYWGAAAWGKTLVLLEQTSEPTRPDDLRIRAMGEAGAFITVDLSDLDLETTGGIIRFPQNRVFIIARSGADPENLLIRDTQTSAIMMESNGASGKIRLLHPNDDGLTIPICLLVEHHVRWLRDRVSAL
ncbi:MAG: hypothetical protein SGI73_13740 [Chloroflexota bacterium]|nr:hypothetical protein [Chloroflexota bacterium]